MFIKPPPVLKDQTALPYHNNDWFDRSSDACCIVGVLDLAKLWLPWKGRSKPDGVTENWRTGVLRGGSGCLV